jgi:hypothetical protein
MKAPQLLAWLMCLALAFFAAVLSMRNTGRIGMMQKTYAEAIEAAAVRNAILEDIRDLLRGRIDQDGAEPEDQGAEPVEAPED